MFQIDTLSKLIFPLRCLNSDGFWADRVKSMGLKYSITRNEDAAIITLQGEMLDRYFALYEECLIEMSMITEKYVIIDMSQVKAIDSHGLEVFQTMWLTLARTDVELRVCGLQSHIKPYFSVILVDDEMRETLTDCLESFGLKRVS